MKTLKFIGTTSFADIKNNFGTVQWQDTTFYYSPLEKVIVPPPMFLVALGSAGTSLPTISLYGLEYVVALDMLRQDFECGKPVFDLDRYVVKPFNDYGVVYMEPPNNQHHLNQKSEIINKLDSRLQFYIRQSLIT